MRFSTGLCSFPQVNKEFSTGKQRVFHRMIEVFHRFMRVFHRVNLINPCKYYNYF